MRFLSLLSLLYERLWKTTTGRPYTHIMRDYPWLYAVPALILMIALALLRRRYGGWLIGLAVGVAAFLGFVAGHVFW